MSQAQGIANILYAHAVIIFFPPANTPVVVYGYNIGYDIIRIDNGLDPRFIEYEIVLSDPRDRGSCTPKVSTVASADDGSFPAVPNPEFRTIFKHQTATRKRLRQYQLAANPAPVTFKATVIQIYDHPNGVG